MVNVKPMRVSQTNYAVNSIRAFLKGKKNLKWVMGVIESSEITREDLQKHYPEICETYKDSPVPESWKIR